VFVAERSPLLTASTPGREPPVPLQHIAPAGRTERHRWGEPSSAVVLRHRHRRAQDRVVGWSSAVRTTGVGDLSGSHVGRSVDHRPSRLSSASTWSGHRALHPAPSRSSVSRGWGAVVKWGGEWADMTLFLGRVRARVTRHALDLSLRWLSERSCYGARRTRTREQRLLRFRR